MERILLSEFVKSQVSGVLKTREDKGFITIQRRVFRKCKFDQEACERILESFCIRKESVLRYLEGKYVPTYMKGRPGAVFRNQSCLQKCIYMKNEEFFIHIRNSEPHKIITDVLHCYFIMGNKGIFPSANLTILIERTKTFLQNIPVYTLCVQEWHKPLPYLGRYYRTKILSKYDSLEKIASIKFSVIKKKLLTYYLKQEKITRLEMLVLLKNQNFRQSYIRKLCQAIYKNHNVGRM